MAVAGVIPRDPGEVRTTCLRWWCGHVDQSTLPHAHPPSCPGCPWAPPGCPLLAAAQPGVDTLPGSSCPTPPARAARSPLKRGEGVRGNTVAREALAHPSARPLDQGVGWLCKVALGEAFLQSQHPDRSCAGFILWLLFLLTLIHGS